MIRPEIPHTGPHPAEELGAAAGAGRLLQQDHVGLLQQVLGEERVAGQFNGPSEEGWLDRYKDVSWDDGTNPPLY